jgi:lambda repressor-like predicted transcriptional regulator
MAAATQLIDQEAKTQAVLAQTQDAAPLLRALIECSNELQKHALDMLAVLIDPETDHEDRFLAASTLADVLYPNTHEGDRMLGMDLKEAERIAMDNPEAGAALAEMDHEESTFAQALDAAMRERGLSQSELAQRVGIGQPAISMMLARECRPQKRTVRRLAEALGMQPGELWPNYGRSN